MLSKGQGLLTAAVTYMLQPSRSTPLPFCQRVPVSGVCCERTTTHSCWQLSRGDADGQRD